MASTSKNIQRIAHESNQDTRKIKLNYGAIKKRYFQHVTKNAELLKAPLSTAKAIEEKIKKIAIDPKAAKDLMVGNVDGKKRLYLKKSDWSFIEVLSVEEAFDFILETHVECNHGDAETTYEKLTESHSVPIFCVHWLVASCNVCSSAKVEIQMPVMKLVETVSNNPSRRGIWRLNVIEDDLLIKNRGSTVSFLLIFKEDSTNFILLRPLFESPEELALEITKLFTEFGYPEKVFVPNMIDFYTKIFQTVRMINNVVDVPVEKANDVDIFTKDKDEILREIKNWMDTMHDSYWEQCCHIVQYKMNTTQKRLTRLFNKEEIYGIPFNLFFEYRFSTKITYIDPPFNKTENMPSLSSCSDTVVQE